MAKNWVSTFDYCIEVNRTYICLDLLEAQTKYLIDFYESAEKHVTIDHQENYVKKRKILKEKAKVLLVLRDHFKQRNETFFIYFIFPTVFIFLVIGCTILCFIDCKSEEEIEEDEMELEEDTEDDEMELEVENQAGQGEDLDFLDESESESEDIYTRMRTSG